MIGRSSDWKPQSYQLLKWARAQARETFSGSDNEERALSSLAAHLLLVLATYADGDEGCSCFPSIRRLTEDVGLTVNYKADGSAHNSRVYEALSELQELQLIWRSRRGRRRRSPITELLMPPDWEDPRDRQGQPSAQQEGRRNPPGSSLKPSDQPSRSREGEVVVEVPPEAPPEDLDRHPPAHRRVSTSTPAENGQKKRERKRVRTLAKGSLRAAGKASER